MSEQRGQYSPAVVTEPSVVAMPRHEAVIPTEGDLKTMLTLGEQFIKSGLMPPTIKTAAAAVVIIQKGRELRIPPMQAINGINVIQGKPTCSAELMLALIYRDHGDNAIRWVESSDERVVLEYKRKGWAEPSRFTWSAEDSRKAGLSGGNHAKFPQAMMRARAVSAVARMAFSDTIGGMYETSEWEEVVRSSATGSRPANPSVAPRSALASMPFTVGVHTNPVGALRVALARKGVVDGAAEEWVSEQTGFTGALSDVWSELDETTADRLLAVVAQRGEDPGAGVVAVVEGSFTEAPATNENGDQQRALAALHAAAADLGMTHDDIKQFVADGAEKPVSEVRSMSTWSPRFINRTRELIVEKGLAWVQLQPGYDDADTIEDATFTDQPD